MSDHWLNDERDRGRFWASASELGLSDDEVHHALEVDSVYDFGGSEEEARAILRGYARAKDELGTDLMEYVASLPEAPVLIWTEYEHRETGHRFTVSYRMAGMPEPWVKTVMKGAREQMELFVKAANHYGWDPVHRGSSRVMRDVAAQEAPRGPQGTPPAGTPQPPPQRPAERRQEPQGDAGDDRHPGYDPVRDSTLDMLTAKPKPGGGMMYEFEVAGMQYLLKDYRGTSAVVNMFDAGCFTPIFTAAALAEGGVWTPQDYGTLHIRYGKSEKGYWDVLKVYR